MKKNQSQKNQSRTSKNCGIISKDVTRALPEYRRKRKNRAEEISEVAMVKNFAQLMTDTKPQIREAQRTSNGVSTRKIQQHKITFRHIIFKLQLKTKMLKEAKRGKIPFL